MQPESIVPEEIEPAHRCRGAARRGWLQISRAAAQGSPLFLIGCIIVALSLFLAVFGPVHRALRSDVGDAEIAEPPPRAVRMAEAFPGTLYGNNETPPHWLGTDQSGLDVFLARDRGAAHRPHHRTGRHTLVARLGTLLGLITGFFRNWATEIVMRVSDVAASRCSSPHAAGHAVGPVGVNIVIALALVYTPIFLRLTRAEVLSQGARLRRSGARRGQQAVDDRARTSCRIRWCRRWCRPPSPSASRSS